MSKPKELLRIDYPYGQPPKNVSINGVYFITFDEAKEVAIKSKIEAFSEMEKYISEQKDEDLQKGKFIEFLGRVKKKFEEELN